MSSSWSTKNQIINSLNHQIRTWETQNNNLETSLKSITQKYNNWLMEKKTLIDTVTSLSSLSNEILEVKKELKLTTEELGNERAKNKKLLIEFNEFKTKETNDFSKTLKIYENQWEHNNYQIENATKIEKLNDILYFKVLDLEKIITEFHEEQKETISKLELQHQKKLGNFKIKMLDFMRSENEKKANSQHQQAEWNNKLNWMHIDEVLNELEYQSKYIESWINDKEKWNRKIFDLSNDLKIYVEISKNLIEKNNKFANQWHWLSKPIKEGEIKHTNTQGTISQTQTIPNRRGSILLNKTMNDQRQTFENLMINNNNKDNNCSSKSYLLIKEIISKEKEIQNYKSKYETLNTRLTNINSKYSSLFNLFNIALEKISNDLKIEQYTTIHSKSETQRNNSNISNNSISKVSNKGEKIFFDLDKLKCYDSFESMTNEEKYATVVLLINTIIPWINDNMLEQDILGKKWSKIKTKYLVSNSTTCSNNDTLSSTKLPNTDRSHYGNRRIIKEKLKLKSFEDIPKPKFRTKLVIHDTQLRLNSYSLLNA